MRVTGRTRMARWGGAILVALAPLPWLGLGTAVAGSDTTYATVSGHAPFSADANHPGHWGSNCTYLTGGSGKHSLVLTKDYAKVIVKSGAGNVDPFTNTIFKPASAGETVWADTNGDKTFNPGGQNGDKEISHTIVCGGGHPTTTKPEPSHSETTTKPEPSHSETTTKPEPSHSETTTKPEPSHSETTTKPEPSHSETTTKPEPSHSETTTKPEPSNSETTTKPEPSNSETTGSASPSTTAPTTSPTTATTIETGTSEPGDDDSEGVTVAATRLTQAAALAATGSGMPVGTALAISMLLIGLGALLLIGPGRLIAERYHRKH